MIRRVLCFLIPLMLCASDVRAQNTGASESEVRIRSGDWVLVGDLMVPDEPAQPPVVLLLNQAAGNRTVYRDLARRLAARGMASLRLDLRGHGESTNMGQFVPGGESPDAMIWDAEADVVSAAQFLRGHPQLEGSRIGVVGGSYSGEEMAEAGRIDGFARAYVALSPGSFSEETISGLDSGDAAWLFIASRDERYLTEITASVRASSSRTEVLIIPGTSHATNILESRPDVAERIAVWLAHHL
ncbi:MAG: hypothetical protein HKN17_04460 [Rhodothermales bacterium]|nr:hypothetical protein [Rhodothermales bacterium]